MIQAQVSGESYQRGEGVCGCHAAGRLAARMGWVVVRWGRRGDVVWPRVAGGAGRQAVVCGGGECRPGWDGWWGTVASCIGQAVIRGKVYPQVFRLREIAAIGCSIGRGVAGVVDRGQGGTRLKDVVTHAWLSKSVVAQ